MYLTQGLHRSLQRHPEKLALVHISGAQPSQVRRQTFAHLHQSIALYAAALQAQGVRAGDRVGLLAVNSDELVTGILACWWLGAAAALLNVRWSATEVAHAVHDSDVRAIVADQPLQHLLPPQTTPVLDWQQLQAQGLSLPPVPDARLGGEQLACILYTGGTTGQSKGVMLSHANLWTACMSRAAVMNSSPDTVSLMVAPLFHVAGLGRLVGQIIVGGTCITMQQFRPQDVQSAIATHGITDTMFVPTMLQALLDSPGFDAAQVQSLNRIGFGAAPMPPALLERALQVWPQAEFYQAYGLTETSGSVCINVPENHRSAAARAQGLQHSVGRATAGSEVQITDEQGNLLPPGEVGEVVVRGPMVMQGYWRRPEATQAAFRHGWFRTGDAGRMDANGYVYIVDRLKDMVITGGENVYCSEVEAVLCSHPLVAQAAVIGRTDPLWGEAVHAVVVLVAGATPAQLPLEVLRDWCRERLAAFKCPRGVDYVAAMPTSAAGKVLKNQLRQQFQHAPQPDALPRKQAA